MHNNFRAIINKLLSHQRFCQSSAIVIITHTQWRTERERPTGAYNKQLLSETNMILCLHVCKALYLYTKQHSWCLKPHPLTFHPLLAEQLVTHFEHLFK